MKFGLGIFRAGDLGVTSHRSHVLQLTLVSVK